jgi:hypothetical protein
MPTGRNGRLCGLILILTASAGVYLVVVVPLVNLSSERQSALDNQRMFAHRPEAADKLLELRAQASERRGPASARKFTLEGFSDAAASAELQSHIEELGTSIDTTIDSTESISAEVRGSYHPADPRYVLVGAYETWVRRFAKLEAATPPLVIDNLHIQSGLRVDERTGRPRARGPATPTLNAGPDFCGFRTNENLTVVKP